LPFVREDLAVARRAPEPFLRGAFGAKPFQGRLPGRHLRERGTEMTIATALLLAALCAGTDPARPPASEPFAGSTEPQQGRAGVIIAADIEGRLSIYDGRQQLVVELNKPAGRQLQLALEPGVYEVRLTTNDGTRRSGILISEEQQLLVGLANFSDQATGRSPVAGDVQAGHPPPPRHLHALDPRHRIEARFGGWGSGRYDDGDDWHYAGSAQGALGVEYLSFVRNDLGIGVGLSSLVRVQGDWDGLVDAGTVRVTTSVPVIVRWYPARRVTRTRSVEPYVTAGIGAVFGVDSVYVDDHGPHDWHYDDIGSARVGTTIGGRLGGGVDFRLGSVFTLGAAGAWNWDAGFSDDLWTGPRPGGGEFTVVLGWNFGR
jgi:hypothetical protein